MNVLTNNRVFSCLLASKLGIQNAVIMQHVADNSNGNVWYHLKIDRVLTSLPFFSKPEILQYIKTLLDEDFLVQKNYKEKNSAVKVYYRVNHKKVNSLADNKPDIFEKDLTTRLKKISENDVFETQIWNNSNIFSKVFENIIRFPDAEKKFNEVAYTAYMYDLLAEYQLVIPMLVNLSKQWLEWHSEQTSKPKSVKASFRTWVKNYVSRRDQNPGIPRLYRVG